MEKKWKLLFRVGGPRLTKWKLLGRVWGLGCGGLGNGKEEADRAMHSSIPASSQCSFYLGLEGFFGLHV